MASRTAPAEDDRLSSGLIDHSIALQAAGNTDESFTFRRISRDQARGFGGGLNPAAPGTVSGEISWMTRNPFLPSATRPNVRSIHASDLDGASVIERAAGVKHLVQRRGRSGIFDIDNG